MLLKKATGSLLTSLHINKYNQTWVVQKEMWHF